MSDDLRRATLVSEGGGPAWKAQQELEAFHRRRTESVRTPQGFLALVNTQWITDRAAGPQSVWGAAGLWSPAAPGESGLRVTAQASDGVTVDGRLVEGEVVVRGKDDPRPSTVVFGPAVTGYVIHGEEGYALRVWDHTSEANQRFGSIDAFPYNPDWVVEAAFTPNPEGTTVGFEHVKSEGRTRELVVPGSITFTKDGIDYDVAAFQSGRALQLVFADATSGATTYGVGRFLFTAPRPDGSVPLDFNRAVLPPCAFSYSFNCPLPPAQNRFTVPVEAGEKNVLDTEGRLLHA
ncbi:MAG TPA: DUF1684 domain-containing protein [Microbacteriaceae bacterium]|nr:DUF1684 domain-containing protein [Microbacteriaceae bacterium]